MRANLQLDSAQCAPVVWMPLHSIAQTGSGNPKPRQKTPIMNATFALKPSRTQNMLRGYPATLTEIVRLATPTRPFQSLPRSFHNSFKQSPKFLAESLNCWRSCEILAPPFQCGRVALLQNNLVRRVQQSLPSKSKSSKARV